MMSVDEASSVATAALEQSRAPVARDHVPERIACNPIPAPCVCLLTGGGDKPYALGMANALSSAGLTIDFIGSDELKVPELLNDHRINFLNLRGDQRPEASPVAKAVRVLTYYVKLLAYATTARPKLFHILWNNKFQLFDRTLLMLYYRLLGKQILFTAHNVNAGKRDSNDSWVNRVSLKAQFALSDHIFVHTEAMKRELIRDFRTPERKISVIPFGINNTVPNTSLSSGQAKQRLGLASNEKVLLFFGNIAPYKGLEYLVSAFNELLKTDSSYRLLIVGRPKGSMDYWGDIQRTITKNGMGDRIIETIEYVPDEATELYFKAAGVLVLPYTHVYQSGVLFLSYSFGLPVIATDVGSLQEEIIEGETGFLCRPQDSADLARAVRTYFASDLYRELEARRGRVQAFANERYSWARVGEILDRVYRQVLEK